MNIMGLVQNDSKQHFIQNDRQEKGQNTRNNFKKINQKDALNTIEKSKMPLDKRTLLIIAGLLIGIGIATIGASIVAVCVLPLFLPSMVILEIALSAATIGGVACIAAGVFLGKIGLEKQNISSKTSEKNLVNIVSKEKIPRDLTKKDTALLAQKIHGKIKSLHKIKVRDSLKEYELKEIFDFIEANKKQWYDEIDSKHLPFKYLKHSANNTIRTIRIDNDGQIYVFLKDQIGKGGQKTVRLAIDYNNERLVANAVTTTAKKNDSVKEVKITKKFVGTPNVIQIGNTIRYKGIKHIRGKPKPQKAEKLSTIQNYYEEGCLKSCIDSYNLTPAQKKQLVLDIINGLKSIHEKNVLHRDIKSLNIFIEKSVNENKETIFHAYVADFGLGCHVRDYTSINDVCGSPLYIAPENYQLMKKQIPVDRVGFPVDYYSSGVVIAEILNIKNFPLNPANVLIQKPPLIFTVPPAPNEPGYLVWRLTQENPKDRPSLDEVLTLIEQVDWNISKKYT